MVSRRASCVTRVACVSPPLRPHKRVPATLCEGPGAAFTPRYGVSSGPPAASRSNSRSVSLVSHGAEIFQCFLSAREVARGRERERAGGSGGSALGSSPVPRGQEDAPHAPADRRGSSGLPEGQDLYTAACNSVIHRCVLLVLGVSPVLAEPLKRHQEEGPVPGPSGSSQDVLGIMTRWMAGWRLFLPRFLHFTPLIMRECTIPAVMSQGHLQRVRAGGVPRGHEDGRARPVSVIGTMK